MSGSNFSNVSGLNATIGGPVRGSAASGSSGVTNFVGQAVNLVGGPRQAMNIARDFVGRTIWPDSPSSESDEWGMVPDDGTGPTPDLEPVIAADDRAQPGVQPDVIVPEVKEEPDSDSEPEAVHESNVQEAPAGVVPFMSRGRAIGGIRALVTDLSPEEAPNLSPTIVARASEVEDVIEEMSRTMHVDFTAQAIAADLRRLGTADLRIAALQAQIDEINVEVADTRALMPTYRMVMRMRLRVTSKQNKRLLKNVDAMSCRVQEAKRRRH